MSVLTANSVLVLNRAWMPIDVTTVFDAVSKVCNEGSYRKPHAPRARFVDPETYQTYDFEEWVDTWEDAVRAAQFEANKAMVSSCLAFRLPEVIVLTEYDGMGGKPKSRKNSPRPPKFSRRNVYLRDSHQCQYCGKKCRTEESNLDHVVPKSKGGGMNWKNIVVACIPCNDKKRNRTPEEAGMKLIRPPRVPKAGELPRRSWGEKLKRKLRGRVRPSWEVFLGNLYWEIALKDD